MLSAALFEVALGAAVVVVEAVRAAPMTPPWTVGGSTEVEVLAAAVM
jgi:hypothetical protein